MPNGSFVVKNVGIQFQNTANIPMEELENQKSKIISSFKSIGLIYSQPNEKIL